MTINLNSLLDPTVVAGGDVVAPASTSENKIPQWSSVAKTLKEGLAIGTTAGTIAAGDDSRFTDARAPTSHTQLGTTVELSEVGTATYDDLQDFVNIVQSGGRISGGVLSATAPADGTIAISALKGFVKITDSDIAETKFFDLDAQTGVELTDNATNYIYVEYNAGTPRVQVATDRTTIRQTDQFTLGRAFRSGTDVEILQSGINVFNRTRKVHERWIDTFGGLSYASGIITTCTGLKPAISAGVLYAGSNRIDIDAKDCNATGTFESYYWNPTTSAWVVTSGVTSLSATQYNKTDTGTGLANLGNGKYTVHWLYVCPDGDIYTLLGQAEYTLATAQAASAPVLIPPYLSQWAKLAAKIIILKSATTVYSVTLAWATQFPVQVAGDHSDLAGLQGGTTDQYYHLTAAQLAVITGGGAGLTWSEVTGTTQAAAVGNGYIANNAELVTVTLPATAPIGSVIKVVGKGAGMWKIAQAAGQQIVSGASSTTIGITGYMSAAAQYDTVELVCITADTLFSVVNSTGSPTLT